MTNPSFLSLLWPSCRKTKGKKDQSHFKQRGNLGTVRLAIDDDQRKIRRLEEGSWDAWIMAGLPECLMAVWAGLEARSTVRHGQNFDALLLSLFGAVIVASIRGLTSYV